jgi:hypothetical protein
VAGHPDVSYPHAVLAPRLGDAALGYRVLAVDALGVDPEQDFEAVPVGRTNSARADTRLHFLAGRLEPYRANGSIAEFFDAYREATVPEPRRPD